MGALTLPPNVDGQRLNINDPAAKRRFGQNTGTCILNAVSTQECSRLHSVQTTPPNVDHPHIRLREQPKSE